jgi:hypothetical protein
VLRLLLYCSACCLLAFTTCHTAFTEFRPATQGAILTTAWLRVATLGFNQIRGAMITTILLVF